MTVSQPELDFPRKGEADLFGAEALYDDDLFAVAPPATSTGLVKVFTAAGWTAHAVKVWTGTMWRQSPVRRWTGASWT